VDFWKISFPKIWENLGIGPLIGVWETGHPLGGDTGGNPVLGEKLGELAHIGGGPGYIGGRVSSTKMGCGSPI